MLPGDFLLVCGKNVRYNVRSGTGHSGIAAMRKGYEWRMEIL